jgi:ribonuclease HI
MVINDTYIEGLRNTKLNIKTNSLKSIMAVTRWFGMWKYNKFKSSTGKEIENLDLIKPIVILSQGRKISYTHVYSHRNIAFNDFCSQMASKFLDNLSIGKFIINKPIQINYNQNINKFN